MLGGFRTSHESSCPHVAPECATREIPVHEHHVEVDLTHFELVADYGLRPGVQLSVRLPFDIKDQAVRYTTLDGHAFDPPYGDIHHRNETLSGFSDALVSLGFAPAQLNSGISTWSFRAGLTLPIGETIPDPMMLGEMGIRHQHLQFGTGTVHPRFSAAWMRPVGATVMSGLLDVDLPLQENDEGFRASRAIQWSLGPAWPIGRFLLHTDAAGQYQSIAKWNGVEDEGSGVVNGGVRLRFSAPLPRTFTITGSAYFEAFSHSLHEETFEQTPTFAVSLGRIF